MTAHGFALEDDFHVRVTVYLERWLAPPSFWTTFPAGGGGAQRGSKLKRLGLKAGVPDILLFRSETREEESEAQHRTQNEMKVIGFWRNNAEIITRCYGLELKASKGRLSEAQHRTQNEMKVIGFQVATIKTLDDLRNILNAWNFPIREKPKSSEIFDEAWKLSLQKSENSLDL